jgi:hypothetical protein
MEVIDLGSLEWTEGSGNDEYDSPAKGFCDPAEDEYALSRQAAGEDAGA